MRPFIKQFVGSTSINVFVWAAIFHVVAYLVRDTQFELPALIAAGLATLVIAWKSLPAGLMIALAEIFMGGHGHLLDYEVFGFSVSLRMVIFAAVMLVWLVRYVKYDVHPKFSRFRDIPWVIIGLAVLIGTVVGLLKYPEAQVLDDMNGYLTMLYLLPIISIEWDQKLRRELVQVLFGSAIWLVFFTLLLSYLFTHLDGKSLHVLYTFVRDSRLAEITLQTVANDAGEITNQYGARLLGSDGYFYRIFMQSQIVVAAAATLFATGMFFIWRDQRLPSLFGLSLAGFASTLFLSLSRSFYLGLAGALVLVWFLAFWHGRHAFWNVARRSVTFVLLTVIGFTAAYLTVVFPLPQQPDISEAAFYSTSAETEREVAISSRWQLLGPMMEQIYSSPVLGSGFGTEVTFITDDPRIREINPNGEYTTYRFEWGYQDIWLKLGLLGLLGFAWYAAVILIGVRFTAKRRGHAWIVIGLGAGILMLFVAHSFSPYLNHPLGLGLMLFILPFLEFPNKAKKPQMIIKKIEEEMKIPTKQMSPAMSVDKSEI